MLRSWVLFLDSGPLKRNNSLSIRDWSVEFLLLNHTLNMIPGDKIVLLVVGICHNLPLVLAQLVKEICLFWLFQAPLGAKDLLLKLIPVGPLVFYNSLSKLSTHLMNSFKATLLCFNKPNDSFLYQFFLFNINPIYFIWWLFIYRTHYSDILMKLLSYISTFFVYYFHCLPNILQYPSCIDSILI